MFIMDKHGYTKITEELIKPDESMLNTFMWQAPLSFVPFLIFCDAKISTEYG